MLTLIFHYLLLPFLLFGLVLRFLRKYGKSPVSPDIRALCAADPIEPRRFRAVRARGAPGRDAVPAKLGDFETLDEAVDAIYRGKSADPAGAYLALNDKGEALQEV